MSGWKKGPMPKGTYGWGGVVPHAEKELSGFFMAGFNGDTVTAYGADDGKDRVLKDWEVAWYCNPIQSPPPREPASA